MGRHAPTCAYTSGRTEFFGEEYPKLKGEYLAIKGEIVDDQGHLVKINKNVFKFSSRAQVPPMVATILAALTTNPDVTHLDQRATGTAGA